MKVTGEDGARTRRGPARIGRDLVLAVGLAGIGAGGLALFLKTAQVAGDRGSGVPVAVLVGLALLGALAVGLAMARRRASSVRSRETPHLVGAPDGLAPAPDGLAPAPDGLVPAPDGQVPEQDGLVSGREVPDVGAEALDHAAVDADGFEHAVAALCARDGCSTVEVVGGAGDLGADVVAVTLDGLRVVLQCKHYAEDNRVGSQDLQRFGGTCFTIHEADVAVLVTTSSFTAPAAEYAATCGIVCVDGDGLAAWTDQLAPPPWDAFRTEPAASDPLTGQT
ncbi:restriction endonuclease [Streptomyces sp. NPDC090127]|uniref:restriction endonuclease n=1 Tax=Streptomyces sp. NPDC090127 TaxID=3365953 RepID=UPI003818C581